MPSLPAAFSVDLGLPAAGPREAWEIFWATLDREGIAGDFEAGVGAGAERPSSPAELDGRLTADPNVAFFSVSVGGDLSVTVQRGTRDPSVRSFRISLGARPAPDRVEQLRAHLRRARRLVRDLFERHGVRRALLHREGGGAMMFPQLPLVAARTHAVVTARDAIAEAYGSVEEFLAVGWSTVSERDGRVHLERAPEALTAAEYFEAANRSQRALARLARPGRTTFDSGHVEPEEEPLYAEPETLRIVGYLPEERTLQLSAVPTLHEHVPGRDIDRVVAFVRAKKLPDGRPVDCVRITFLDQDAAEREKRPLLEAGAEVQYYDADGALRQVRASSRTSSASEG